MRLGRGREEKATMGLAYSLSLSLSLSLPLVFGGREKERWRELYIIVLKNCVISLAFQVTVFGDDSLAVYGPSIYQNIPISSLLAVNMNGNQAGQERVLLILGSVQLRKNNKPTKNQLVFFVKLENQIINKMTCFSLNNLLTHR